jgi:hypothetical protein
MGKLYTHYSGKVLLLFLLTTMQVVAQKKFGNEWINPAQTYLRIPVIQTGVYKITFSELRNAGFPVDSFPVSSLQLFRRGREVAIEITHSEEKLKPEGYLTFYGQKNDGALDSTLYVNPEAMPHAYYSLYSDTASYFLTCNKNNIAGKRIEVSDSKITQNVVNDHINEVLQINTTDYPAGNLYPMGSTYETGTAFTTYGTGEGWTGKELQNEDGETLKLSTENLVFEKAEQTEVEILLVGRSAGNHQVEIWSGVSKTTGRKLALVELDNYNADRFNIPLTQQDISTDGKIVLSIVPVNNSGSVSVSYVKWRYPQKIPLTADSIQHTFYFKPDSINKTISISNAENRQFYDVSNPYLLKKLVPQNTFLTLNSASQIIALTALLPILKPRLVKFSLVNPETDYLIISHPLVRNPVHGSNDPVKEYADYRASQAGGSYKPFIMNSEEIFDQFNYGEPGPLGIRNAISFLHTRAALKFVLILGKSIDPQTARHQLNARQNDMIPNAGWPGSDIALAMGLSDSSEYIPLVPVGRVNAATSENVYDYLQKVKAVESQNKAASWRKNILHLSGGHTQAEREVYREYVESFERRISESDLGAKIQTLSKQTDALKEEFPLDKLLNKGIGLITMYGHSSLSSTDLELGLASDEKRNYKNDSLYPAIIMNGCALGNSFYSPATLSNNWILTPNKGAVLFLAHTHNGVSTSLKHYTDSFYNVLSDSSFIGQPFGIIQKEAIRRNMLKYPTLSDGITAQQMNLQGDPAIRLFPATLPDYTWETDLIKFSNPYGKTLAAKTDSVKVQIVLLNQGKFRTGNLKVNILRKRDSVNIENYQFIRSSVSYTDTLSFIVPNKYMKSATEIWTFSIDPESEIAEENKDNNVFSSELTLSDLPDEDTLQITSAYVSPNPSARYFQFQIELKGSQPPAKWTIFIFDKAGRAIDKREIIPHLGINKFVWQPKGLSAGVYLYKMEVDYPVIRKTEAAEKGMSGKLIWMH